MSSPHHAEVDYENPTAPPRICLNCSSALRGPYCAQCGQPDVDYHRSFHHLTHDLLENLFHFEGKFFVSVAWLLAKPGKLTAEFNAGRRASQVNPLRLYIFVTVLFFLGVHALNNGHLFDFDRKHADTLGKNFQRKINEAADGASSLSRPQGERFAELLAESTADSRSRASGKTVEELIEQVRREIPDPAPDDKGATAPRASSPGERAGAKRHQAPAVWQSLKRKLDTDELTPSKLFDQIESRVPTMLFLGMPILALLLKLLYWRSGRYYIEHLIFSVHLHTWAFLAFMVSDGYFKLAGLGPRWLPTLLGFVLVGWTMWYVLSAFRHVYQRSWPKTIIKVGLVGVGYSFALLTLAVVLVTGTLVWLALK